MWQGKCLWQEASVLAMNSIYFSAAQRFFCAAAILALPSAANLQRFHGLLTGGLAFVV